MQSYMDWARRHPQAAAELAAILTPPVPTTAAGVSEARVQSEVRLEAASKGVRLWRNNSGAMTDDQGRLVRFGLGHEGKQLNERIKSSDLIGWRPVLIGPQHVGTVIARFVSVECKTPGWKLTPGDKRGQAQAAWLALVMRDGGQALFATGGGCL